MSGLTKNVREWLEAEPCFGEAGNLAHDFMLLLVDESEQLQAERDRYKEKYEDLIYCVASKFPNESRHETAKRYIQQREQHCEGQAKEDK